MVEMQYFEKEPPRLHARRRKIINIATICIICLLIIFYFVYNLSDFVFGPSPGLNSNPVSGEWTMFRHDITHSGSTYQNAVFPQGTVKWTFPTDGPIYSSPAVVDGTVYFGSRDGKLYALDATTGAKRWEFKTGNWVDSSPAIINGVVYFGSNDGKLYALKADTGQKFWEYDARYPIRSSPTVAGRMVYFGCYDYGIYALDITRGTKRWCYLTEGYVYSSPLVANGIVYAGSMDNFCYALHAKSGRLRLRFRTFSPSTITSSPVAVNEVIYFNSTDGYLYAIDGNARNWPGEIKLRPFWATAYLWGMAPRPSSPSGYLWRVKVDKDTTSSPVVKDGALYLGTGKKLVSVDLSSYALRWTFDAGGSIESSPAIAGATIYAATVDGRLYALDANTGKKNWDLLPGGNITSSPALANGMIYIGSHDGNLYAIK